MQFNVNISDHDYSYRVRQIERFLTQRNTVLAEVQFKGRQITHFELGEQIITRLLTDLAAVGRPAGKPNLKGRDLQVLILPK